MTSHLQLFCLLISAFFFYFLLSALPQLASQLIGVGYPLYATSWALRSVDSDPELLKSWLVYWTVYGAFSLIDSLLVPVLLNVAVYWLAKIVFLFYLVCTHPLGTTELLEKGLNPAIDALDRFSSRYRLISIVINIGNYSQYIFLNEDIIFHF
jgi:receptor expression-enhancing protein 5/6